MIALFFEILQAAKTNSFQNTLVFVQAENI